MYKGHPEQLTEQQVYVCRTEADAFKKQNSDVKPPAWHLHAFWEVQKLPTYCHTPLQPSAHPFSHSNLLPNTHPHSPWALWVMGGVLFVPTPPAPSEARQQTFTEKRHPPLTTHCCSSYSFMNGSFGNVLSYNSTRSWNYAHYSLFKISITKPQKNFSLYKFFARVSDQSDEFVLQFRANAGLGFFPCTLIDSDKQDARHLNSSCLLEKLRAENHLLIQYSYVVYWGPAVINNRDMWQLRTGSRIILGG